MYCISSIHVSNNIEFNWHKFNLKSFYFWINIQIIIHIIKLFKFENELILNGFFNEHKIKDVFVLSIYICGKFYID